MKFNGVEIKICDNVKWLYRTVYRELSGLINKKANPIIGFATGSTMLPLYNIMVDEFQKEKISFKSVLTFNLDEYLGLNPEDKNSYHYFMHQNLFNKTNFDKKKINLINGITDDPQKEIERYNKLLDKNPIDIQLLGIGANGHIAFNEPGCDFEARTNLVNLNQKTVSDNARFFDDQIDSVPKQAITMGIKDIMNAKRVILIATGKNKANAVSQLIHGQINKLCPASILRKHENCCIYLDNEAARLLKLPQ